MFFQRQNTVKLSTTKLSIVVMVAAMALLGFAGVCTAQTAGEAGIGYYYAARYDMAIRYLRQALAETPGNVNLRYYLADALVKEKRLKEARAEYRRILEEMPDSRAGALSAKALDVMDHRFKRWTVSIAKVRSEDLDWEVSAHIRQPDPVELQQELGKRIRLADDLKDVSIEHLTTVKKEMAKLPLPMINKFLANQGEVRVVGSLMKVERTSTHDNIDAAGLCDVQRDGRVLVYLTVQGVEQTGSRFITNVTLHEMGHAMDYLAANDRQGYWFSRSDSFKALYTEPAVREYLKSLRKDGYYLSAPQEGFAQLFAAYFHSDATRRELPGEVQLYFRNQVIPTFEAFSF